MKRRILAMLLAIVMVFGMLPMQALADEVLLEESAAETLIEETEALVVETEAPAEEGEAPEEETEAPIEETEPPTEEPLLEEPELLLLDEAADTLLSDAAASEGAAADPVLVYVTVSNQGVLAKTQSGEIMRNKPVTVTDINRDGYLTYDEALSAAHDAYCPGGFSVSGGAATKLWGVEQTTNYLFFKNDVALTMGITVTDSSTVAEGDKLYASVNKDNVYWADWYTYFDKTERAVDTDTEFTLNLQGYLGMGGGSTPEAVGGVSVGIWKDGTFKAIEGKVTDASGNVTLSFPEAGVYYVTASGTVSDEITDWSSDAENPGSSTVTVDCPIMAPCCVVTVNAPAVGEVTVNATAQLGADFLAPPLIDEEVSGNLAESYGFTDRVSVANVSALDVLVKVHEKMFGEDFTKDTASEYLVVSASGWITKMFAEENSSVSFLVNSAFPADDKGTGYCVDQAQVKNGDLVQFVYYEDTTAWSDACVWLELEDGTKLDGQSVSAGSSVDVVVKKYASYGATDTVSVPGTAVYLVDTESGVLTKLADTDDSGKATIEIPRDYANSTRYVTAYGTYTFMTLAKVSVGDAIAETVLTGLEIAVGGGTMDDTTEQTLTPAFSGDTMSYSTPILDYVADSTSRFVWVKATAPENATLTAKCGSSDVATLTSGEWKRLDVYKYWPVYDYIGTLETGTYNKVEITLSAEGQDDMVYTVTVPMQPDIANQSLTWKTNLKSAIYYTTNAEGACLSVEAQYQNRPLENEDVITYQWYRNTTASTEGSTAIEGATSASFALSTAQTGVTYYYAVASCGELKAVSNIIEVTVTDKAAPKSVTLIYDYPYTIPNDWVKALGGVSFVATIGDKIQIRAVDENGEDTPVSWSTQCYGGTLDEKTGIYTITGSSNSYLTAYSLYDSSISSGEKVIQISDYKISAYNRDQSVALSKDGQTKTKASLSAGVSGYNIWDFKMEPEGIAQCTTDLTQKGSYVEFNLLRPGTITISYTVDVGGENDPVLTDSTTRIITGAAVEDAQGNQGKTYLELTGENKAPTAQLKAYLMEGRTVASWSSADEAVATVDENGQVTGHAIGATIITATDSEGTTGGIKVIVTDADKPTFENIAFTVGSMWSNGIKTKIEFKPETTEYTGLELTRYQASSLDLTADTLYNTEKLTAVATYTDSNGEAATVDVNSGVATKLPNIPFGTSTVTITLTDKQDAEKKTDYTFEVTRPRDTTQQIYNTTGIVVKNAEGGALSADQYQEQAEGYLFRANSDGTIKNAYTVDYRELYYRAYLLDARPSFTMLTKGKSDYVHMRYSVDEGATWKVLPQGGGSSDVITFPERTDEGNPVVKITLQVVSDKTYVDGGNAFPETVTTSNGTTYTIWVEQLPSADAVKMLTASADIGDWYPTFDPDVTSYKLSVANGSAAPVLTYTIAEGTTVSVGSEKQEPNEAGEYTLTLTTSAQTVTITSADGSIRRQYSFQYFERVAGGADKVVDYLAVNSQYTNSGGYGMYPEYTLGSNSLKSLGNFGGYITYYFEDGLTDNPANQYGVDFYINGNAFKDTSTGTGLGSMEPGQVWVSEDGSTWFALAGSEHYDADTLWDYTVTYSKNGTGTSWSDNYGNSNLTVGRSFSWPLAENYPLNTLAKQDSFTLTGVLIPSVKGITGNDDFSTYSSGARFGYVDALVNGTANPYAENDSYQNASSGFDLAWAVDDAGNPVDVSGKSFHYVKVVTASNIVAGAANEKSTEVANIFRADAQAAEVGTTADPTTIAFTEGNCTKQLILEAGKQIYEVELAMEQPSITVTAGEGDNIYINSQRVASGTASEGFAIEADSETLVRIIVQSGDREPVIFLLKLKSAINFPGSGTEANPYRLENAAHLDNLNELVSGGETFEGKYFKITNDITVSDGWDGIGYARVEVQESWGSMIPTTKEFKPFMGTLDGQGYTVTFPAGSQPLFDCVRNATIKNIKISGDIADDGLIANYAQDGYNKTADISGITILSGTKIAGSGLLGGYASGSNVVNIDDCHIEEGVTIGSAEASNIGGIAGDFNGTISNSSCAATVYGKDFVGGIVAGQGQSMSSTVISDCVFSGQVIATGNYVGGISGCGYTGTGWGFSPNAGCIDIKNCTVSGSITGGDYVGGILGAEPGVVQCWSNATGEITGNTFTGTISTEGQYAGGVIGYMKSINRYNIISGNRYKPTATAAKGIGGATYIDTSYANPTPIDGVTYVNSANGKTGISGMSKTDHNRTDDPLGADKDNLADPTIPFSGSGTEEDPFLLGSAIHLIRLNRLVSGGETFEGKYFKITNDITVSDGWDGIGYARVEVQESWGSMIPTTKEFKPFMGTLDGQGYTVTFPAGSQPLFDCVRNATIKNIKISGDIADDGLIANYAQDGYNKTADISGITILSGTKIAGSGLLGGYASGSNVVNIDDCHIEEGVTIGSAEASNIGGIAGDFNGTISNSSCAATVYGKDFVGGIVAGQGQSMSSTVISDCVFSGQVIATGNYVGGISGCGYTGTGWGFSPNAGCIDIKNCTVSGSITGGDYVGGILGAEPGVVQCWSNATGEITGNTFTGTISTEGQYAGGVIGYMKSINRYNIISGNRYKPTATAAKGIGGATYIDTSYANPTPIDGVTYVNSANGKTGISGMSKTDHNRTDDPLGVHENDLSLYDSTLEVDGGNEVVGGKSITVRVVDSETGRALKTSEVLWSLASPDYEAYATVSASGKLKAYPVSTQHVVRLVGKLRGNYSGEIRHTVTIYPATTQVEIWSGETNVTGKTLYLNAAEGTELDLTGKLYPTNAKEGIFWKSSNAKIATVTDGVVAYAGKTGTVTITATAQDGSGKNATVKVQVGILTTDVKIVEPASATLRSGKSVTLSAVTTPEKPTIPGVTFALANPADSAYATVSASGKVTAKTVNEPHKIRIIATSKDATKVQSEPLTLTILPKSEQMLILKSGDEYVTGTILVRNADAESISLSAFLLNTTDSVEETKPETLTWKSSMESVASVDNGTVTLKKAGTAVITATSGKLKASVTIKVTNLVSEISVTPKSENDDLTIASGKAVTLKATVLPADAANKKVTWSITEGDSYAKISGSGVLTANKNLTETVHVKVTATAVDGSGIAGSAVVTINPISQGIRILLDETKEPTNTTLVWDMQQNAELNLSAKVYPIAAEQDVTWSSSSAKVAAVDQDGKVTCRKAGTVTITATAKDGSGKKASFKLTVVKRMTELKLSGNDIIAGGKSLTLKALISPADTTNKKLTWSISENGVGAKISSSGKLTTKKVTEPTAVTITAAAQDGSGMTATHKVTIYPATTKVTLSAADYDKLPTTLAVGKKLKLVASCNEGAANQYTWSSSSTKVATVDANGLITTVKPGTVTITATAKDGTGKNAAIKLTVVQLMENLTLSGNDFVAGGKSLTLKPVIAPADTTNKKLTWSISENAVGAKISSSGKLTTKKVTEPTAVTITAAARDGSGMTATHTVTIYPATTSVALSADGYEKIPTTLAVGETLKLVASCNEGAANQYTWKSNNKYVTVKDGTVAADAKAVGKTVTITCTAADGTGKPASVKIRIVAAEVKN